MTLFWQITGISLALLFVWLLFRDPPKGDDHPGRRWGD